jgi:acyl-CoA reductase-like NAD-dependent aldehyde dehydrogenase
VIDLHLQQGLSSNGKLLDLFDSQQGLSSHELLYSYVVATACTQAEVNKAMETAKTAQKSWAKTPLWKRAELLHKAAAILKEHKAPIAECLVKEIAKPAKDAVTEVSKSF